jgi:photosystem II stability/assembly factor-like uncharacterized protein
MKKILSIICFSLSIVYLGYSQEYIEMIESGNFTVDQIIKGAEDYFNVRAKGKGTGYKQFKRWEYNAQRLMDENGKLNSDQYYDEIWQQYNAELNRNSESVIRSSDFWTELGPESYSATTGWNPGVGRITAFYVNPQDNDFVLIGAESGGIWKTENGGANWISLTDNFSNLAVESIAVHPNQENTYFFGSTSGRIYKSTDGGNSWSLLGTAGNSRIRRILINPENPQIMFACSQNAGFYRSEDEGKFWTKKGSDNYAYDILFKPGDYNTVYASGYGFHKSTDGGQTFAKYESNNTKYYLLNVISPQHLIKAYDAVDNGFTSGHVDIPLSPDSIAGKLVLYSDTISGQSFACTIPGNTTELKGNIALIHRGNCVFVDKVMRAQNAGAKAVIMINNVAGNPFGMGGGNSEIKIPAVMISQADGLQLIETMKTDTLIMKLQIDSKAFSAMQNSPKAIAVSPDNPDVVYLLEAKEGSFSGFFKSNDSGTNFYKIPHTMNFLGYSTIGDDDGGQAPRNMEIAASPFDADEVHIGGILTWQSFDGGKTFSCTSDWVPNRAVSENIGYCHADINRMQFVGEKLFVGSDGGVFKAENTKEVSEDFYNDFTEGLGIRHFYKIGISATDPVIVSGGSQDNGTSWYSAQSGWNDWLGADGMETFIDKNNKKIMYGTIQFGGIYSKDENDNIRYINAPDEREGNWVTPFEQDPIETNTIYIAYEAIYKSKNKGYSWTQISPDYGTKFNHLKIAKSDNNVIYAAYVNEMYKTIDGGKNWAKVTGFSGNINSIAIHPRDPQKVAIAVTGTQKVYVSQNGGNSWTKYLKNLPNFSALALVWQDDNIGGLYLGMNYGVFYINNTMTSWLPYSTNLPNVIINELEINETEQKIYAATYGRGLWVSSLIDPDPDNTSEINDIKISLSPNPISDKLNISINNVENHQFTVELYDLKGQRLRKYKFENDNTSLFVGGLTNGMYFVKVSSPKYHITKKININRNS